MSVEQSKEKYKSLFTTSDEKAAAFDKIVEKFYYMNFGTTNKSDIETLMFSIYIEQILKKNQENMDEYSDYTLSKLLGITQSKVSNLKVKKELLYPYKEFNWKESFKRISDRAVYEDGKIKLFIPDRNLYLELKNAIETNGGYIEAQLTSNLLQVRLPYFLDLLVAITDEADRDKLRRKLREKLDANNNDENLPEYSSFGKAIKEQIKEGGVELVLELLSSSFSIIDGPVKVVAKNIYKCIKATR